MTRLFFSMVLFALPLAAHAQPACPSGESFDKARAVVADLQRIVTPAGVQDTYAERIGGIEQWIQVRGKERANPMILFVHGGPSSPAMPSACDERLSFEYGLERARAEGNAAAIAELESIAPYPGEAPITRDRIIVARKWPQHYGGLNAYRDAEQDYYYGASLLAPDYDCEDRRAFFAGNVFTLGHVWDEYLRVDFSGVREFPIPVLMFLGRHDYTTPSAPTAEWLEQVHAPYKRAVWFEHSAHMIPWEEPGRTLLALLEHVRPLAGEP